MDSEKIALDTNEIFEALNEGDLKTASMGIMTADEAAFLISQYKKSIEGKSFKDVQSKIRATLEKLHDVDSSTLDPVMSQLVSMFEEIHGTFQPNISQEKIIRTSEKGMTVEEWREYMQTSAKQVFDFSLPGINEAEKAVLGKTFSNMLMQMELFYEYSCFDREKAEPILLSFRAYNKEYNKDEIPLNAFISQWKEKWEALSNDWSEVIAWDKSISKLKKIEEDRQLVGELISRRTYRARQVMKRKAGKLKGKRSASIALIEDLLDPKWSGDGRLFATVQECEANAGEVLHLFRRNPDAAMAQWSAQKAKWQRKRKLTELQGTIEKYESQESLSHKNWCDYLRCKTRLNLMQEGKKASEIKAALKQIKPLLTAAGEFWHEPEFDRSVLESRVHTYKPGESFIPSEWKNRKKFRAIMAQGAEAAEAQEQGQNISIEEWKILQKSIFIQKWMEATEPAKKEEENSKEEESAVEKKKKEEKIPQDTERVDQLLSRNLNQFLDNLARVFIEQQNIKDGAQNAFSQRTIDIFLKDTENLLGTYRNTLIRATIEEHHPIFRSDYWSQPKAEIPNKWEGAKDPYGNTSLILAIKGSHSGLAQAIISTGIDVNSKNANGFTALALAAGNGMHDVVKGLINAGADVNTVVKNGNAALMYAIGRGHFDVVKTLLLSHANPMTVNDNKQTPLMRAAEKGHMEIVKALVQSCPDVLDTAKTKDKDGNTAISLAAKAGHKDIVKFLSQKKIKEKDELTILKEQVAYLQNQLFEAQVQVAALRGDDRPIAAALHTSVRTLEKHKTAKGGPGVCV